MLPNLIIPGAPRAGTSSLYGYLSQHPQIFFPALKEPRFFIAEEILQTGAQDPMRGYLLEKSISTLDDYRALYAQTGCTVRGDASAQYLYHHHVAIPRIKKGLGDPRIIIVLRDPVARAWSNFEYVGNRGFSFGEELELEDSKMAARFNSFWYFKRQGLYFESVRAYLDSFSAVRVLNFDELSARPAETVSSLFKFLGVDATAPVDVSTVHNASGKPKNKLVSKLVFEDNAAKRLLRPLWRKMMSPDRRDKIIRTIRTHSVQRGTASMIPMPVRDQLATYYRDDVVKLQRLTKLDLSNWIPMQ